MNLPDFVVLDIWSDPPSFSPGQELSLAFYAKIKNIGADAVYTSILPPPPPLCVGRFFLDDTEWLCAFRYDWPYDYLPWRSGEERVVQGLVFGSNRPWPFDTNYHTVKYVFDLDDLGWSKWGIQDSNLSNNWLAKQFRATGYPQQAVFKVHNLNIIPSNPKVNETVTITATIDNTGNAEGAKDVWLKIDGVTKFTVTIDLPPGYSQDVRFTGSFDQEGSYKVEVATPDDSVYRMITVSTAPVTLKWRMCIYGEINIPIEVDPLPDGRRGEIFPDWCGDYTEGTIINLKAAESLTIEGIDYVFKKWTSLDIPPYEWDQPAITIRIPHRDSRMIVGYEKKAPPPICPPSPCSPFGFGCANPASVYCTSLGYELEIVEEPEGQVGMCIFPDGSKCEEWSFFKGECGQQFSYCERFGGGRIDPTPGYCDFALSECAVCILPDGSRCLDWDYCAGECP